MTVSSDMSRRASAHAGHLALEDRFEVLKEIGDGSFGSVVLARVRTAGANVARRGTVVSCTQWKFRRYMVMMNTNEMDFTYL